MDNRSIPAALDDEIERLQNARKVLPSMDGKASSVGTPKKRSKRRLSPETRAKIAAAQKRRWAAAKKATST
jgi:hypothetical protein